MILKVFFNHNQHGQLGCLHIRCSRTNIYSSDGIDGGYCEISIENPSIDFINENGKGVHGISWNMMRGE